ncbi:TldD/PmbA family protein [Chloroflexota bacterium]
MPDILTQARKVAEEAEVYLVTAEETPVIFEANRLKHIQGKQKTAVALRLIRQGKIGYGTSTTLDDSQSLVSNALETAQFGTRARFEFPAPSPYPQLSVFDPEVASVPIEAMVKLGEDMIDMIRAHTPDIVCEGGVTKEIISVRIINSRGGEMEYKKSIFAMGIEGSLIRGTDMLFVGDSQYSCHPLTEAESVAGATIKQLELAKTQASVPSQSLPVIFTPNGIASALISPLLVALNGKTVLEGASPIGDKLGQAVFNEALSLRDDPTLAYCPGSRPGDDEGVPSQCTPLIEGGGSDRLSL